LEVLARFYLTQKSPRTHIQKILENTKERRPRRKIHSENFENSREHTNIFHFTINHRGKGHTYDLYSFTTRVLCVVCHARSV
jgi:hypothetical protein